MRRFIFVGILMITLMLFSQAIMPGIIRGRSPLPEWVKPGVFGVFEMEGGFRSYSDAKNAFYGRGFSIFVVVGIYGNVAYGYGLAVYKYPMFSIQPLGINPVIFYMSEEDFKETMKEKEEYAKEGIKIEGGVYEGGFWLSYEYKDVKYSAFFDHDGNLQRLIMIERSTNGVSTIDMRLVAFHDGKWPQAMEFPNVSEGTYSYDVFVYDAVVTGMTLHTGNITLSYKSSVGPFKVYEETFSSPSYAVPLSLQSLGSAYLGPFYVNPSLCELERILESKEMGFVWKCERVWNGWEMSMTWQGRRGYWAVLDSQGLALEVHQIMMGNEMIYKLAR